VTRGRPGSIEVCSAEDCEQLAHARGLCSKHYKRWRLYGDVTATHTPGPKVTPDEARCIGVDRSAGFHKAH
jgi:hypothetical protein